MADIKIAFFDIDGTLLPFEAKHLLASTVDALARLRKNGVKTKGRVERAHLTLQDRRYICRTCTRWTAPPLTAMSR